jgi:hypothetical protein
MKNKKFLIIFIVIIAMIFISIWLYLNTGLKGFEKEISNFVLPDNIEKIAMKSGIGDSGGNGDYSTYRVVLVVKTEMSLDELKQEFANRNLTSSTHILNSGTPICYITKCENSVFESARDFTLTFKELENVNDFTDYYFIECIK